MERRNMLYLLSGHSTMPLRGSYDSLKQAHTPRIKCEDIAC